MARLIEPEKISKLETKNKKLNEKLDNLTNTVNQLKQMIIKGDLSFITPLPDVFAEDQENEAEISLKKYQKAK